MSDDDFRDHPINDYMWSGFIQWAWSHEGMRAEFEHDTGTKLVAPRGGIEGAVDKACRVHETQIEQFVEWATRKHWGEDDAPKLYREKRGKP